MAQQTAINGNRYDFTSLSCEASSSGAFYAPSKGVMESINYDATQEPGIVQGNSIVMVGRTAGYGVGSGSFSILASEFDDFAAQLTGNGAVPLMAVDFTWTVSFSVNGVDVRTDTLRGCRITKVSSPNQKGNEAKAIQCDMSIARIALNGIEMFADPANS